MAGQRCEPTHGPQTNWWSDDSKRTNDEDTDDEGTHARSAKTISQEDAETTEMGVVDAAAAKSYNPSKLSDTTRYAPKCQSALRVALGAMLVMSVANCSGLTQSLSKCGEFVRENKMGMQSFPSARRLGITLFGNAPNSEAPSYQKFAESIPDELETVISFGDEVKGDSERWNLRIQDYLPTFRGAQSLVPHADKFMWVRAIRDWCRRGYSQLRLVFATAACNVTFSVMAVDSRGKPVHKMGVFAWTEMLIPAWTVYLLTPLLAGLLAFGAVADPETGELYELRIFHGVVGVAKERSILVLTWTIMAGTVAAAVAACKAIIDNYVARNSRGPPVNEGVEATQPLSQDEQLGRRELAAKAEKNDNLFIEMHGKELFEVKKEVVAKHGYSAWVSVRHFIEANGIEAWREEKKRFAELGFERWRVGRRSSYVEALRHAARIEKARRSAVLAARAARDPDDKYVQKAHNEGLMAALEALVSEGSGEEVREAWAELEVFPRAKPIQEARWDEKRKAHAASGRSGNFAQHGTDFAGVWGNNGGFQMKIRVGGAELRQTYRDVHVAALAYDIAGAACGRAARNYPTRAVCLAAPPPPDVLQEMMRQAAGGGSCVRVVLRETVEQCRVRWVVSQTLARELSRIRETEVRRELVKLRERDGVLDDVVCDAIAARVDALDLERMLGDRLRAEGFAAPPGNGRGKGRAAPRKKRRAERPAPTGQWTTRAERAAKRAKTDA